MLALALPFLTRNWRLVAAGIALITALSLLAAERSSLIHKGQAKEQTAEAARVVKAQAAIVQREAKAQAITTTVADKLSADTLQIHQHTADLQARVKTYVPPSDDAACRVSPGFVSLYNAAVSGAAASPPGAPSEPRSPGPVASGPSGKPGAL